ncbi:hypothetical protein PILCRDRAFT_733255 [Piloderma croceum F 1598]|uniref:Uncharacterized protein n=1 Tax=Piloderma croceum (strain F 1598) TaxID=765440 RepID=A0A0C3EZK2_PILCF|nr:hypothetical protein PILCRDRAFT_733255 [Piloderma croceum F 1598]
MWLCSGYPAFSCMKSFPSSQTVHEVVQSLWRTIGERVDKDFTSETTKPSATVVLSESRLEELTETPLSALAPKNPTHTYFVLFGMPSSWSNIVKVSEGNRMW